MKKPKSTIDKIIELHSILVKSVNLLEEVIKSFESMLDNSINKLKGNEKMPFKSKKQLKKFAVMEKQGKIKKGTTKEWAAETPNIKKLPIKVKKKK